MLILICCTAAAFCFVDLVARRGNGGRIGELIRSSDHHAWKMAVINLEQELAEIRRLEPTLIDR